MGSLSALTVALVAVSGLLLIVTVGLATVLAGICRELNHMVQELEACRGSCNGRLTVAARFRPVVSLSRVINALLDAHQNVRLEDARLKRAFQGDLAALSHDIRTPLAGAQGYLELYGMTRPDDVEKRAAYFAAAQERLAAVRTLVDDLFEYTKAVTHCSALETDDLSGQVPSVSDPTCVHDALSRVLAAHYPAFEQRGWEPHVSFENERVTVFANPVALERIIANLVSNALKHGASAPRIVQRGQVLTFSNHVANAAAIDPTRLFERFYRADHARAGAGSGLGLAIVAQLCKNEGIAVSARLEADELYVELLFPEDVE